jgi:folate-binding protein YgfZ
MAGAHTDTLDNAASAGAVGEQETLASEYRVLVEGCGMLDRSERGKLALSGPDAVEFLNGQVTNELLSLRPGSGCYAAFLTHKGKMLGDLRILAVGAEDAPGVDDLAGAHDPPAVSGLLLDTERVALQSLFDMIRRFKVGYQVELDKRTLERGLLSLIGPGSAAVAGLESIAGVESISAAVQVETTQLSNVEHAHVRVALDGVPALAVRTDVGVDLLCDAADTGALSAALCARGATAVSEAAVDCLRIERGRPRYGADLDDSVIPQEAGLNERAVSFTKGCYVGQETVARLHYKGRPNRHLRGLRLSRPAASGEPLLLGERAVGYVGSVAVSPTLGPIALALVRREAEPGTTLGVGYDRASAIVFELPFAG